MIFIELLWGPGLLHALAGRLGPRSGSTAFDKSLPLERGSLVVSISDSEYHTKMGILVCVSLRTCREFSLRHIPRSVPVLCLLHVTKHCWAFLVVTLPSSVQHRPLGPHHFCHLYASLFSTNFPLLPFFPLAAGCACLLRLTGC